MSVATQASNPSQSRSSIFSFRHARVHEGRTPRCGIQATQFGMAFSKSHRRRPLSQTSITERRDSMIATIILGGARPGPRSRMPLNRGERLRTSDHRMPHRTCRTPTPGQLLRQCGGGLPRTIANPGRIEVEARRPAAGFKAEGPRVGAEQLLARVGPSVVDQRDVEVLDGGSGPAAAGGSAGSSPRRFRPTSLPLSIIRSDSQHSARRPRAGGSTSGSPAAGRSATARSVGPPRRATACGSSPR